MLKDLLNTAEGQLAGGKVPSDETMQRLESAYGQALTQSECPCGSHIRGSVGGKRTFGDCCKMQWQSIARGVKKAKQEAREDKKEKVREEKAGPAAAVEWFIQLGIKSTGEPAINVMKEGMGPLDAAGFILTIYHQLMAQMIHAASGARQSKPMITG